MILKSLVTYYEHHAGWTFQISMKLMRSIKFRRGFYEGCRPQILNTFTICGNLSILVKNKRFYATQGRKMQNIICRRLQSDIFVDKNKCVICGVFIPYILKENKIYLIFIINSVTLSYFFMKRFSRLKKNVKKKILRFWNTVVWYFAMTYYNIIV